MTPAGRGDTAGRGPRKQQTWFHSLCHPGFFLSFAFANSFFSLPPGFSETPSDGVTEGNTLALVRRSSLVLALSSYPTDYELCCAALKGLRAPHSSPLHPPFLLCVSTNALRVPHLQEIDTGEDPSLTQGRGWRWLGEVR